MSDPLSSDPGTSARAVAEANGAASPAPTAAQPALVSSGTPGGGRAGAPGSAQQAPGVPAARRRTRGRWMTLLLLVVGAGLALGVIAAILSAPLRGSGRIVATPLPSAAGAARAGGGGPGGAPGGEGAGPAGTGGAASAPGGAAAAGGAGRTGGVQGAGSPAGGQAAAAGGPASQRPGGAGTGAGGPAAGRTNGVIQSIVDGTMVVSTPDGPVHVTLGDSTSVQRVEPADKTDLAPGQRVVVSGSRGDDGTVAANDVQILPGDGGQESGNRGPAGGAQAGAGNQQAAR